MKTCVCGAEYNDMTTSRQKAIGSQAERDVAYRLGGKRSMGYGPTDVETDILNLQVKQLTVQPSMNAMRQWLDRIPYDPHRLRGVVVLDRPGVGHRTRRTIVFDLDEYAEWYGDGIREPKVEIPDYGVQYAEQKADPPTGEDMPF